MTGISMVIATSAATSSIFSGLHGRSIRLPCVALRLVPGGGRLVSCCHAYRPFTGEHTPHRQ